MQTRYRSFRRFPYCETTNITRRPFSNLSFWFLSAWKVAPTLGSALTPQGGRRAVQSRLHCLFPRSADLEIQSQLNPAQQPRGYATCRCWLGIGLSRGPSPRLGRRPPPVAIFGLPSIVEANAASSQHAARTLLEPEHFS